MSELIQKTKEIHYRRVEILLNKVLDNKDFPINSKFIYLQEAPVAVTVRLDKPNNHAIDLNRIKILKTPEEKEIRKIYVTTTGS